MAILRSPELRWMMRTPGGPLPEELLGQALRRSGSSARIVVVGGGFGGAVAARTLRLVSAALEIVLVTPVPIFHTGPFSNHVLAGLRPISAITQDYRAMQAQHGITVLQGRVTGIDRAGKCAFLSGGERLPYDHLVLAPGIDMRWDAVAGYDEMAVACMPHAWQPGLQTELLRMQLEAMDDGGVVLLSVPPPPFRCVLAAYERASLIAHYLQQAKPRSKILVLDANDTFPAQALFEAAWQALYGHRIERVPGAGGGHVIRAEPATMTLETASGDRHRGAVVNLIPPQWAAAIARDAGLTDATGWCPVRPTTFVSHADPSISVIGDACSAGAMPKSAFAASAQARVAACAIVGDMAGGLDAAPQPSLTDIGYSLIAPDYGISSAGIFFVGPRGITPVEGVGSISPLDADGAYRAMEARCADRWYQAVTQEAWGV